ncbi:MAG: nSTAND1 domain-containing NTPase [Bacteroidia bacterium]
MFEEKICPYPGLRPFNDDESIFFKGREHNIEVIVELFEKKKFMMLTGASGDGKSSLVYAGVVPHARAGLFKAKYNSWAIADFRPERSPLDNLTGALNKYLGFANEEVLKKELSYGFSSLIDIYKRSPLYIDTEGKEWQEADDAKKKQLKRKASNLLIIADQFEEFFTNAENYHNGIASVESQTVINLLLEAAKIALAQDIPIYIICTMRSDYIGQCAAFRGLPEYIGFSQFFVPRLKRNEISQVIEEPAQLNGDSISRRLSERLLNDITEGYDQLPILQHALNQIWKMTGNGKEEMDLIHYAKVGGLSKDQLPEKDKEVFAAWFDALPEFKKQLFKHPSLENILNAHANELYETAFEKCKTKNPEEFENITPTDAKLIIKTTYQCLTKIDEARAVRNRMTQQEITDILNQPNISNGQVGGILDIFREQGNTFIKPFITEHAESKKTGGDTVLDITHESLIRNWDLLDAWAKEEYDNWLNFQDFNKQLQRWVSNGKDKGYLLPIGPLTFFENWFNTCKPNKYWLARYDDREISKEEKLAAADETLTNAHEFIRKSASRLFFSRTVLKYGANKLITYLAIFVMICSCTYYYFDYKKKQNENVLVEIEKRCFNLLGNNKVNVKTKANFVINYERLHPGSFKDVLNNLPSDTLRFDVAFNALMLVQNVDDAKKPKVNPMVYELTDYLDLTINKIYSNKELIRNDVFFNRISEFIRLCAFLKSFQKNHESIDGLITQNLDRLHKDYIIEKLNNSKDTVLSNPVMFFNAMELILNYSEKPKEVATSILGKFSPWGNESAVRKFQKYCAKERSYKVSWDQSFTHNGGYQEIAYLYAVAGDEAKVSECLDTIIKTNPDYKNYWNLSFRELAYYMMYSTSMSESGINNILKKYEKYSSNLHLKLIESMIYNMGDINSYSIKNREITYPYENYINNVLTSGSKLMDYYLSEIKNTIKDKDELNFKLALFYKLKGRRLITFGKNETEAEKSFAKSMEYYNQLPKKFIENEAILGVSDNADSKKVKRSILFLYPASINETQTWSIFNFWGNRDPECFLKYVDKNFKLSSLYFSKDEFKMYEDFLYNYYSSQRRKWDASDSVNYYWFDIAEKFLKETTLARNNIDTDFLYLVQAIRAFEVNDISKANAYYSKINLKHVTLTEFQKGDDVRPSVNKSLLKTLTEHLALNNKLNVSFKFLSTMSEPYSKRNTLIDIAYKLQEKGPIENCFRYLDTLYKEIDRQPNFGLRLLQVNGMIGSQFMYNTAIKLIKNVPDNKKPRALVQFIKGVSYNGFYYKALNYIPDYVSSSNELELYSEIIKTEAKRITKLKSNYDAFSGYDWNNESNYWTTGDLETGRGFVFLETE